MNFIGSEGPMAVLDTIAISNGLAILFAMTLYFMDRKHGAPWLVASAFMAAQAIMMWVTPSMPLLSKLFQFYAMLSPELTIITGMLAAVLVGYFGWLRGIRAIQPSVQTSPT